MWVTGGMLVVHSGETVEAGCIVVIGGLITWLLQLFVLQHVELTLTVDVLVKQLTHGSRHPLFNDCCPFTVIISA